MIEDHSNKNAADVADIIVGLSENFQNGMASLATSEQCGLLQNLLATYRQCADLLADYAFSLTLDAADSQRACTTQRALLQIQEETLRCAAQVQARSLDALLLKLDLWHLECIASKLPEDISHQDQLVTAVRQDVVSLLAKTKAPPIPQQAHPCAI